MRWLARLGLCALLLFSAACGPLISVCRICLKSDPQHPVATADLPKLRLAVGDTRLPVAATNVYYREACGIDCQQWLRLDLPRDEAAAFLDGLSVSAIGSGDDTTYLSGPVDPVLSWWPNTFSADARIFVATVAGGTIYVVTLDRGATSRLWIAVLQV